MTPARPATLRQVLAIAALQLAATVGAQPAGGPTVQPVAPPTPVAAVDRATPFPKPDESGVDYVRKYVAAPAMTPPPVVAPSVEWYTAAARREYDRLHPR